MNRVKAGDAWARVSTKRYGSRLDGNEARIETPSLFLALAPSFLEVYVRDTRLGPRAILTLVQVPRLFRLITRE